MMTKIETTIKWAENIAVPGAVYGVAKVAEGVQSTPEVMTAFLTAENVGVAAVITQIIYLVLKNARERRNINSKIELRNEQIKDLKNGKE